MKLRRIVQERRRPQEFSSVTVDDPDPASFRYRRNNIPFLPALYLRVEPFHVLRIGIEDRSEKNALMRMVFVPIVAQQILVVPIELARLGIKSHCKVAVKLDQD